MESKYKMWTWVELEMLDSDTENGKSAYNCLPVISKQLHSLAAG